MPAGKRRRARLANVVAGVTDVGGPLPVEQPLDALVDDQALGAERGGERDHLVGAAAEQPTCHRCHVPDQAPVAGVTGCGEQPVGERMPTQLFEQLVGGGVEGVDRRAELAAAGHLGGHDVAD